MRPCAADIKIRRMKILLLTLFLLSNSVYAAGQVERALKNADLSIPYYGDTFYGQPKAQIVNISRHSSWLITQARYGGDGHHSENILMIFELHDHPSERIMERSNNVNKIFQYSLSNVILKFSGDYLATISGEVIETLCDVCDGWEASSPGDIFHIPIDIHVPSLVIQPTLSCPQAKALLVQLRNQGESNIKEQLGYGNESYPEYANRVVDRITDLLIAYKNAKSRDFKHCAGD